MSPVSPHLHDPFLLQLQIHPSKSVLCLQGENNVGDIQQGTGTATPGAEQPPEPEPEPGLGVEVQAPGGDRPSFPVPATLGSILDQVRERRVSCI